MTHVLTQPRPVHAGKCPPRLESGDRLSAAEFDRLDAAMPGVKAELIEGIVYVASPVSDRRHGEPHAILAGWLFTYALKTPGLRLSDNATAYLPEDNRPQPDLMLRLPREAGGTSRRDDDGYLHGPPELVCEIAASSASIDLHAKRRVYEMAGVSEYLVWKTDDAAVEAFTLERGRFSPNTPDAGFFKSRVFPGLWLDLEALLAGNLANVAAGVGRGIDACRDAHAAFCKRLAGADKPD